MMRRWFTRMPGSNLAFTTFLGDKAKTADAFAKADHVTELKIINNRLVCNYMEPRSCLSQWNEKDGYKVTVCSQGAHGIRGHLARIMSEDPANIRVITPDVGGGFGTKVFPYREYPADHGSGETPGSAGQMDHRTAPSILLLMPMAGTMSPVRKNGHGQKRQIPGD